MSKKTNPIDLNYTKQEAFDIVLDRLSKQEGRSVCEEHTTKCMYRGHSGRVCAVGALIPDASYSPIIEFVPIRELLDTGEVISSLPCEFLLNLQAVHDHCEDWSMIKKRLREFAVEQDLEYKGENSTGMPEGLCVSAEQTATDGKTCPSV